MKKKNNFLPTKRNIFVAICDCYFIFQAIQKNGYNDSLIDGPKSSWLGYSLLPEGHTPNKIYEINITSYNFTSNLGSNIEFPLLFTENPGFNITSYLAKDEATGCFLRFQDQGC